MKGINLLIAPILFFADLLFANQIIFDKNETENVIGTKSYISEIGDNQKLIFEDLFNKKKYEDILELLTLIPTKSSSPVVQDLIFEILTSKKKLTKNFVSLDEDKKFFEVYIDKLFETGRLNEIEIYYSQYPELKKNEFILKK